MAKVIRLSESQLSSLIRQVIKETEESSNGLYDYTLTPGDVGSYGGSVSNLFFKKENSEYKLFVQKSNTNEVKDTEYFIPDITELKQICKKGMGDEPWDFLPIGESEDSKFYANLLVSQQQRTMNNYVLFVKDGLPAIGKMSLGEAPEDILISKNRKKVKLKDNLLIGLDNYFHLKTPLNDPNNLMNRNVPKNSRENFYSYLTITNIKMAKPV